MDTAGAWPSSFGVPSAAASRPAASYGLSGSRGIDARTAPAPSASTAARDHSSGDASGSGTRPTCRAQRHVVTGTFNRFAAWPSSYSFVVP
ncbi:hypothetical protein [Streptomyces sp. NPDC001404]|uniref:hypothetical protein n=1 Tax=Streptomyces sp. NPDC001404 TaxID=3364571 RepID=UPI0036CDF315